METFDTEEDSVHPCTTADASGRFRVEGADEGVSVNESGLRFVAFVRPGDSSTVFLSAR
jgi:acyl dehydratase